MGGGGNGNPKFQRGRTGSPSGPCFLLETPRKMDYFPVRFSGKVAGSITGVVVFFAEFSSRYHRDSSSKIWCHDHEYEYILLPLLQYRYTSCPSAPDQEFLLNACTRPKQRPRCSSPPLPHPASHILDNLKFPLSSQHVLTMCSLPRLSKIFLLLAKLARYLDRE